MKVCVNILLLACCSGLVSPCGRSRRRPPYDRTRPTITCPPNRHVYADPLQINTKVWWDETFVTANDDRDGALSTSRIGKAPGKLFSEGVTRIKYHARDRSGNYASCSFTITVEVLRCERWGEVPDGWKVCHVSHDMRRGSICRFGCYGGHELVGPQRTECLDSEEWDTATQPYCQKLQCDELLPTPDQYGIVDISCTDSNYYRSICTHNCKSGYGVLPGHSKVRVCTEHGTWRGSTPVCVDTEPPVFASCPYVKVGYAERSKTTGRLWWNVPLATDNSGKVTTTQILGNVSGTDLEVGEYTVQYMASDAVNNTAVCTFNVIVKQIKCHTIYPLPYTYVVCPEGRIFGSQCLFTCDDGTTLNGHAYAQCDKTESVVPYGAWTFNNSQPYCENLNTCPALRAPDNGALACDTWLNGRFCQMLCQEGYVVMNDTKTSFDEVRMHSTLLVCADSGTWYPSGNIPNCQAIDARLSLLLKVKLKYPVYYDGVCEESKEDIKSKFIVAFNNAAGHICAPPQCSVSNVQVLCGDSSGSSDRKRRYVPQGVLVQTTLEMSSNQTSTEIAKSRSSIRNSLNAARTNGDLDIEINGTSTGPSEIEVEQPEAVCNKGSAYKKNTFECVKCNKGYYHDTVHDVCTQCSRGYYQDEHGQTSCKPCPLGTTTETKGAYSSSQCKEACPPGFNSTTGTYPCSACDLGSYSENIGSIECTPCTGSQITLKAAATSPAECREFDVTYNQLDDTEVLTVASLPIEASTMNEYSLTLYVKCEQCKNIVNISGTDDQTVLFVSNTDQLRIGFNGHQYETGKDIAGEKLWKQVTVVNTGEQLIAYLNDEEMLREQISNRKRRSVTTLSATVGGDGFIGSISQMNMWSGSNASAPVATDTCFNTGQGDLMNWRQVSELDGSFVLTDSICDVDDNCKNSPCQNGGTCTDSVDNYSCTCVSGYTGTACEINIDDCFENPCDNNAKCIDGENKFTCACADGFTGELCETHFVNGGWTEWVISSACSVTCGSGVQQLSRVCENPLPINGGKYCEGSHNKAVICETNTTCVNDCINEPTHIENGSMNCNWTDNETRVCKPTCDKGFDFDSDQFINTSGIICGPETGYTWNINNPDNPFSQIPSCTLKIKAIENKVNLTSAYNMSTTTLNSDVTSKIEEKANNKVTGTGCVKSGKCSLENIHVMSSNESSERKRRDSQYVMFTIEIICYVTGDMNECYDLLTELLTRLKTYIDHQEFAIQHDGNGYDVITNSSSYTGISVCDPGHIPVWQYCVSCGKGTYATQDYCENCPLGFYQDEEAQTSCKQCPDGWTTAGLMTRYEKYCNVSKPIDSDIIKWLIYGTVTALSIVVVLLLAAAAAAVCKRINSRKYQTHSEYADNRDRISNANTRFPRRSRHRSDHPTTDNMVMTDFAATVKARKSIGALDNPAYEDDTNFCTTKLPKSQPPRYESSKPVKTNKWTYGLTKDDLK